MSFTPLHVHTEHSSLDGLARIKDIPHAAKAHGFTACALTDHGTPGGLWSFARECQKLGIKPIPGIEAYLAIGSRHDPQTMRVIADDGMGDADEEFDDEGDTRTKEKKYYHLTVLARNRTGWHNLIRFHNETQQTKMGKYPLGDWELLKKYGEGLILLTGCLASPVAGPLAQTQFYDEDSQEYTDLIEDAHTAVDHMIEAVGAEHVFVEIMDHGIESEIYAMDKLFGLAEDRGLSVVATNDSHYMDCDDHDAHSAFLAVGTGKSLHDEGRFQFNGSGYHFKSEDEMRQIAPDDQDWQDAVENTALVAELVEDDTVPEPEIRLPTFALPEGWTSADDYLRHLVEEGAKWRYGDDWNQDDEIVQRIDHELSVVSDMGYSDYFLITWDIINYAQENNITTGPGRGSAAGAILAYTLGITDLCPLRYGLLFERFLERGRVGMPDIDMDFPKHKRHLIHRYCVEKYGYDHVAHIGGFNKAQTKAAIKDAARVHAPQIPKKMSAGRERDELEVQRKKVFRLGDTLAKTIEYGDNKSQSFDKLDDPTSDDEMLRAQEFWAAVEEAGELGEDIVALARRFEGVSKNESIHPCGFVISTEPLFDIVPLRRESKDATEDDPLVIVWDGEMVEDFGLLKMDFLGIQNLDYIDLTFDYLALRGEDGLPQSITDIPDPDGDAEGNLSDDVWAAYDMLAAGRTAGCFQLDGPGMTRVVQDIRPESLNDLSAAVALYRPGPISARMPEDYAAKKHGRLPESYERLTDDQHEIDWLDQVLGETFQNVVYQEQSMRLGQVVAGFDDNQRSTLRKAIGKKKQDLMDKAQGWWFDGSGKEFTNGDEVISPVFSEQTAENVWEFIKGSADYAFNKSHSAAYGVLAYWTAYLKANFPVEYGAAMLATSDNDDKRLLVLADLKAEGIEIVPPAINVSAQHTAPAEGRIMLGLGEIKDVGKAAGDIITTRDAAGEFSSLHEVATRVKGLTVTALRALIEAGAMDEFGPRRGLLKILYAAKKADIAPVGEDFGAVERDRRQRTVLGTVVGSTTLDHVDLEDVQDQIGETGEDHLVIDRLDDLDPASSSVSHIGVVGDFERRVSRTGPMGKAVIEDSSPINLVIFADAYKQMGGDRDKPEPGDLLVVRGKAKTSTYGNDEEGEGRREILASRVWKIEDPTLVEDQPVETSLLVDALEESGSGEEEGDDPDESPDGGDGDEPDAGELERSDDGDPEVGPKQPTVEDEPEAVIGEAGPGWLVAIVADSIDGLWMGRSPILYMEGEPRNHPAASVGENSPIYLDRRGRIAAKLYGGGDLQAEVAELKASAGV